MVDDAEEEGRFTGLLAEGFNERIWVAKGAFARRFGDVLERDLVQGSRYFMQPLVQ
jgi:hypothetical protein